MTTVLIVDDDHADLEIIARAFTSIDEVSVVTMTSPDAAADWLLRPDIDHDLIVVTDLNMPSCDGTAFIEAIRFKCRVAPVTIVMSTSDRSVDVDRAYAAGAHAYHVKPMGFVDTTELCRSIIDYWRATVLRPTLTVAAAATG